YDDLAALVDAHHRALDAVERARHLAVTLAVLGSEFAIHRQIAAIEPGAYRDHRALGDPRRAARGWRQFEAQHVALAVQAAAVEDQYAVAVVDARPRLGRRDQAAQHRGDALRI